MVMQSTRRYLVDNRIVRPVSSQNLVKILVDASRLTLVKYIAVDQHTLQYIGPIHLLSLQ